MNGITAFAKRNLLCFFRDRAGVVFSLMAVLIVIMIYLLFLRNMLVDSYPDIDGMSNLIDGWMLAGILGIVSVTTSAGSLQVMIDDKVNGTQKDSLMTAMKHHEIAAGYILSTFLVGVIMGMLALCISIIYLLAVGADITTIAILSSALLTLPAALSGSIIVYAMTSFLKTTGAFSGFFTVISVLIGFLAGIYMPMGTMPEAMNIVGTLVPASHMAMLFRQVMCDDMLDHVFAGAPDALSEFRTEMGFDLHLGDFVFTPALSLLYVIGVTALFFVIAVAAMRKR